MSLPTDTTAKVPCRTYDPRRGNWHTENLSPEGMNERRATGYGCIKVSDVARVSNVIKTMEAAARESAKTPSPGETNVWDHGQFVPEAT